MTWLIPFLFFVMAAATAVADHRPNIVFLLTDDQAVNTLGCYGNNEVSTPNIDALAARGLTFDRHYNTTAICMASRASIMTGKLEYKTGTNFSHGPMRLDIWQQSYPVLMRQAGYQLGFAGKFGFEVLDAEDEHPKMPEEAFERWGGGEGQTSYKTARNPSMASYAEDYPHATRSYGAFGRDFILEMAQADAPFCLSISFKAPHRPTTPDPVDDEIYAGKQFTKPINYGRENGLHFAKQSQAGRQYPRFEEWGYDKRYDEVMATYHQQIYAIDVAVGMIVDALSSSPAAKNTIIVFTSDNGFFCGAHGYGSKVLPYEDSSRAPLIIVDTRTEEPEAARVRRLTGNIDFAPTFLDYAEIQRPESMDGRSLMPVIEAGLRNDALPPHHETLPLLNFWGPKETHCLSVVSEDWKYIHWHYAGDGYEATDELYHLAEDPHELENLAIGEKNAASLTAMQGAHSQQVQKLRKEAVPFHNYQQFATLFDRQIAWPDKHHLAEDFTDTKSTGGQK